MKLNEKNAKFAVVRTAFHGGGVVSYHTSLAAAERAGRSETNSSCCCGCCGIVPITIQAAKEMKKAGHFDGEYMDEITLLPDLPVYNDDIGYWHLCK